MNANTEGALLLKGKTIQGELDQAGYEWQQAGHSVDASKQSRSIAGVLAGVVAAVLVAGDALLQLLRETAPAGESTFKRQIL